MSRYWSDDIGAYIDVEVIWAGRESLPGLGILQRKGHYLTDAANANGVKVGDLPSDAEMTGKTDITGPQIKEVPLQSGVVDMANRQTPRKREAA